MNESTLEPCSLSAQLMDGERRWSASEFQTTGAAMKKLRLLSLVVLVRWTNRSPHSAERTPGRCELSTTVQAMLRPSVCISRQHTCRDRSRTYQLPRMLLHLLLTALCLQAVKLFMQLKREKTDCILQLFYVYAQSRFYLWNLDLTVPSSTSCTSAMHDITQLWGKCITGRERELRGRPLL